MTTREILTIQLGHYSNFIGAHWWNLQESNFTYDPNKPSEINHDVLYREGENERMANKHQRLLEHLEKVESKGGEILTDRQEIIALDKRINDDRLGTRALQKQSQEKTWITVGPLLLNMSSKAAEELLEKDQRECSTVMNKLKSDLKVKVNELRDLELAPPVPGLMLEPMSHKEMDAMKQVLGRSV